jgi:hypothetical protein
MCCDPHIQVPFLFEKRATVVGCEEDDGFGDLIGRSESPKRNTGRNHLPAFGTCFGRCQQFVKSRRIGRTTTHRVHSNPAVPQIGRPDAREGADGCFCCGIEDMSRSAFASCFVQIVGVPPIKYLANWRMTLAKSALASSDVPMADIAEMAGYQSVSAFSTAFKRETGYSPTLYVRSLQEEV